MILKNPSNLKSKKIASAFSNLSVLFNKNSLKKNKKYIIFTFLKYLEYALTAYVTFSVARLVSPSEYGLATTAFLTITYSLFGSLGINQVLLKWYSTNKSEKVQAFLIQYNLLYNLLSAALIFLIAITLLSDLEYKYYVGLICTLKLIQESTVNINRVRNSIFTINVIYLSFSISFIILYYILVKEMSSFFSAWAISLSVSTFIGLISVFFKINILKHIRFFRIYIKRNFKNLLFDGVKLSIVAFVTPWFLSIDRVLLVNFTKIKPSLIGTMQLSDNISSLVTISVSSIIFIFTPEIIQKIHSKEWTPVGFYAKGNKILIIAIGAILLLLIPLNFLVNIFFGRYENLIYPLSFFLITKTIFIATVVPNLICIAFSKEFLYIKIAVIWLAVLVTLYSLFASTIPADYLFYVYPIVLLICTILMSLHYFARVSKLIKE